MLDTCKWAVSLARCVFFAWFSLRYDGFWSEFAGCLYGVFCRLSVADEGWLGGCEKNPACRLRPPDLCFCRRISALACGSLRVLIASQLLIRDARRYKAAARVRSLRENILPALLHRSICSHGLSCQIPCGALSVLFSGSNNPLMFLRLEWGIFTVRL